MFSLLVRERGTRVRNLEKIQAPSRTTHAPHPESVGAQLSVRRVAFRIKQAHGLNSSTVPTTLTAPALSASVTKNLGSIFIAFGGRSGHANRREFRRLCEIGCLSRRFAALTEQLTGQSCEPRTRQPAPRSAILFQVEISV
jgi:hypothetical protein